MCVTFDGIPYADTFGVQVRWVATRKGEEDVSIQVGLFVDFKKATVLKSQIRNGCLSETKNVHNRLFEAVAVACAVPAGELLERKDEEVKDDPVKVRQHLQHEYAGSIDVLFLEDKKASRGCGGSVKMR